MYICPGLSDIRGGVLYLYGQLMLHNRLWQLAGWPASNKLSKYNYVCACNRSTMRGCYVLDFRFV